MFFAAALGCALPFVAAPSLAMADDEDAARAAPPVVLMELFTSQGCYSCPPAEELLAREYAPRDDILPLELHVDYWDDLIYGLAGSWEDPFSQNAFTQRQGAYNRRIRNTNSMFTPQMIIQGKTSAGGTQKRQIDAAIAKAQAAADDNVKWQFGGDAASGWRAEARGTLQPGSYLYYAVFRRQATTEIPSGENKGKTLINTNVVLELQNRPLSSGRQLALPKLKPGEDCAVWLQNGTNGRVVAAARCPQQSS